MSAAVGLGRVERAAKLAEARDQLRPHAARAFQELAHELGRDNAKLLPDDLLLAAAVLSPDEHEAFRETIELGRSRGRSGQRIREAARRKIGALHKKRQGKQDKARAVDREQADASAPADRSTAGPRAASTSCWPWPATRTSWQKPGACPSR